MPTIADLQQAVTTLQASVQPIADAKDSVIHLLQVLTQKITDLINSGQVPEEIISQINAVNEAVKADTNDLANAVVANTNPNP